jgi:tetratricopeptide (TPR) repeat protein
VTTGNAAGVAGAHALLRPHVEALEQQADGLMARGMLREAADFLDRAAAAIPDAPGLWNRLGMARHALGQFDDARGASDRLVALVPQSPVAWVNRARTLEAMERLDGALDCVDRALDCDPARAATWEHRGLLLASLQRHGEALAAFDRALALDASRAAAWAQRSGALRAQQRHEEALASCERALQIEPQAAVGWEQRAYCLLALGQSDAALDSLEAALGFDPGNAAARFSRGSLLLTLGQFERGWEDYEARASATKALIGSGAPVWRKDEPLAGRTIALRAEQGFGDTIQFCRYAPLLAQRGARVILSVPPSLVRLLGSLSPTVRVVDETQALPPHDLQCPLLSLPQRLGTRLESIPAALPYLAVPEGLQRAWRARLADLTPPGRPRIGLAFSGQSRFNNDHNRSIPAARLAALIAGFPQFEWHLLQKDVRADEAGWIARLGLIDHRPMLDDFCETAALAGCMEIVVSVDTAIAHLAGALGVPLMVLLPHTPEWRWLLDRSDSPWYPGASLVRQPAPGDWDGAFAGLAGCLQEFAARHAGRKPAPVHSFQGT